MTFFKKTPKMADFPRKNAILNIYFGLPGSGKTTFAAYLVKHDLKKGYNVWSNVPITGARKFDPVTDLGHFNIENGRVIIDEASVEFNNRSWKSMPKEVIKFVKYHRHYNTALDLFSQSFEDVDVTFKRLAYNVYWVKKSLIPFFIYTVKVVKTYDIIDGDFKECYKIRPLFRRYVFTPSVWKMFNTTAREQLPEKEWTIY